MENKKILYICIGVSMGIISILVNVGDFAYAQCSTGCTDECSYYGQYSCVGDSYYKMCGNYDCDVCLEWSNAFTCGVGKVCDSGSGMCVTACTDYDHKLCYSGDVYWYDSCGNRDTKYAECGSDAWLNEYQCSGSQLQRKWADRGCSGDSCTYFEEWKNYGDCGSDEWTSNYRCSGDWTQRQIRRKGCGSNSCYDYYEWVNQAQCTGNQICSNGQCITSCTDHDYKLCYAGDVYWYDSCNVREEKYDECGVEAWTGNKRCSGSWTQKEKSVPGCTGSACTLTYQWINDEYCTGNETCSGGECVTTCTTHDHQACYSDDVYWYDSCNVREEKVDECGVDGYSDDYQCLGDYVQRKWIDRGCSGSSCYENASWLNYQNCSTLGKVCSGGTCVWPGLNATCNASPNPAIEGSNVTFTSNVSGGSGSYSYSWTNACIGSSQNCSKIFNTSGTYTASLSVSSGGVTANTSCGVQVNEQPCDCGSWSNWQDQGCGLSTCGSSEMYQTRTRVCTNDCANETENRCIVDSSCQPQCTNDCSVSGQKECSGNGTRTCGNYDSDSCLEWSSVSDCGTDTCLGTSWRNYYCTAGNCLYSDTTCSTQCYSCGDGTCNSACGETQCSCPQDCGQSCTDECSYSGQKRCSGNGTQTCGNYDSDSCLEWGSTQTCSGSTSCGYGTCDNDERPYWNCFNGICSYSCSYDNSCDTNDHDYKQCYSNDVYWYDSNGNRNDKYQDCGTDYTGSWGSDYCKGDDVYESRTTYDKGCSGSSCYSYTDTEERLVKRCDYDCKNGKCVDDEDYKKCYDNDVYWYDSDGHRGSKYEECGSDTTGSWGANYCVGDNVYKQRYSYDRGCSSNRCTSDRTTETKLVERCDYDCKNGKCIDDEDECDDNDPCCDNGEYKDDDVVCKSDVDTQYGCPWGLTCGADTGVRTRIRFQYCSGDSGSCNGDWGNWGSWTSWRVSDNCTANETCSVGKSTCTYNSNCSYTPVVNTRRCDDGDVYWFDSYGSRLSKYDECDDNDSCTLDSCSNATCINTLKCDGSTCSRSSDEYCESCDSCGDGIANCDETFCSCPGDVDLPETGSVAISVLAKTEGDYQKNIAVQPNETVSFLVVVASSADETVDNIVLDNILPSNVMYQGNLKINGIPFTGNVLAGLGLGSLLPNESKHVSFDAKIAGSENFGSGTTYLSNLSKITYKNDTKSDTVGLEVMKGGQGMAAAGSIFSQSLRIIGSLAFWLVMLFILAVIVFLVITGYYWAKKKRLAIYTN